VLMRSGHTEACVDLCRLASLPPVGVLAELMNDNGSVMRGPEVAQFAQKHKLAQVSIAELIAYRQSRDKLVERVGEFQLTSEIGPLQGFAYVTPFDRVHHMAFVFGDIGNGEDVPARLHRADVIGDVFGGAKSIRASLARFKKAGRGVIVYLRDGTAGVPVAEIPHDGDTGADAARSRQWREIGLGAQILKDLGISSIRVLTSSKRTYVGLAGFGIEIVATEPIES
jgi:3,4-dihydroxy 2-butanone 4-phosphate synthase / GTP cyclohydrolase II